MRRARAARSRVIYTTTTAHVERVAETGAEVVSVTSTWEGRDDIETPQMHGKERIRAMNLLLTETKAMLAQLGHSPRYA